jgi:hypothetical protein
LTNLTVPFSVGFSSFADILSEVAQQNPGLRIGVLASGPSQLVQGVLSQCRSRNGVFTGQNEAFFDLHTISYVL